VNFVRSLDAGIEPSGAVLSRTRARSIAGSAAMVRSMVTSSDDFDHPGGSTLRPSILLTGLCLGAALGSVTLLARADEDEDYPLQYAARPLTLHSRTLSIYAAADATRFVADPGAAQRDLATGLTVQAGAKFGLSSDFEVDAALAQVQILPTLAYGNPTLGATFRLLDTVLEIGVRGRLTFVTASKTAGVIAEPSVPLQIHLGESLRIDLNPGVPLALQRGALPTIGLDVPVDIAINLIDKIYVGGQTSLYIADLSSPGESVTVPLGLFAGLSIGSDVPYVEIAPFFTWPKFAQPGASHAGEQKLNLDLYTAGLAVRGYLYF
jgi:hypothetical protein